MADLVFVGDVTTVTRQQGQLRATLRVLRYWKGPVGANVEIRTPASQGLCGLPLKQQERWLIFANGSHDGGFAEACSGSARFDVDVAKLASIELVGSRGRTPIAEQPSGPRRDGGCAACAYAAGVGPPAQLVLALGLLSLTMLIYCRRLFKHRPTCEVESKRSRD